MLDLLKIKSEARLKYFINVRDGKVGTARKRLRGITKSRLKAVVEAVERMQE